MLQLAIYVFITYYRHESKVKSLTIDYAVLKMSDVLRGPTANIFA